MNLLTKIPLKPSNRPISYQSKLLLVGSCFSENIGKKLDYFKYHLLLNPFGILFNPKAVEQFVVNAVYQKNYTSEDVFFHNERWHSFEAHSSLSAINKDDLLDNLNRNIKLTYQQLSNASHIIITLGTAWAYKHLKSNKVVANCHKVPQKEFKKELLTIDDIVKSLEMIKNTIHSINQDCTIILTVSPVRHLKDGFIENQRSKSHLISAIHQVLSDTIFYFPSYELMIDELRDYRFYAEDMLHPNTTAINYIWERFSDTWLSVNESHLRKEIQSIQKGLNHRPFNERSQEHQEFLNKLQERIIKIKTLIPKIELNL